MIGLNQVGRWLGALAVVCLLAVDDIEQEGTMDPQAPYVLELKHDQNQACQSSAPNPAHRNLCESATKPNNIDPVAWARYNESQARSLAALSGLPAPEASADEVVTLEVRTDATGPLRELMGAVRGAAVELQDSNAEVATELTIALARFANQTGVQP